MKTNTQNTFKKSVLSLVVISAITASFISWDDYLPRAETQEMKTALVNRHMDIESIVTETMQHVDSDTLARLAEENLTVGLDAEIDAQVAQRAEDFIAKSDFIEVEESGESIVQAVDNAQFVNVEKETVLGEIIDEHEFFMMVSPLLFAFDSSDINPNYYEGLNDSARFIQNEATKSDTIWQVVGYADPSGNARYNNKLARQRAQNVARYLMQRGVDEAHLSVVSLGASNPLKAERSIDNNRHERRVLIHRYQAEVTALATQHNQQLQQPVLAKTMTLQAESLPKKKAELAPKNVVLEETVEIKTQVAEASFEMGPSTTSHVPIEPEQRLTTAMEL